MVKKIILLLLLIAQILVAQDKNETLATVDGMAITSGELLYAFNKNRADSIPVNYDSLEQYLDRYINFKLKVLEARNQGLDTTKTFQTELNGYLGELKKPYAEGLAQEQKLLEEAHDRMSYKIKASHILIPLDPNSKPKDTLSTYQFLDSLRARVNSKEQFAELAKKYSKDGSASKGGQLGWFSVFMMVYPFESAAYETPVGEVSNVVRTQFGYHLLFIEDKIKAPIKVRTSHIFISNQIHSNQEAKVIARKVYDSLYNGGDWNTLTEKYSEDGQTKMKGGSLPFAGLRQLPDEYLEVAFKLQLNQVSKPAQTPYGWHIIKLDAIQEVPEFSSIEDELKEQIKRSGRNALSDQALINKLKQEYGYQENTSLKVQLLSTDSIIKFTDENLFSLKDREYKVSEFLTHYKPEANTLKQQLTTFEQEMIIAYADSLAPHQYPAYRYLRQEYEEGLLLFEIMQQEVWNKALNDSLGQKEFYKNNKSSYVAPKRLEVFELTSNRISLASLRDSINTLYADDLLSRLKNSLTNETNALKIVKRKLPVSEIASFEGFSEEPGTPIIMNDKLLVTVGVVKDKYFAYDEVKGLVISDFQEALDETFISKLRAKSKIKVNKKALREIVNELD